MRTVVVVQARMGSTRLPGKVTLSLGGKPVLAHVLERASRIKGVDEVVCAIPEGDGNEPVVALARAGGFPVHRGPECDVLQRYLGAAQKADADVIVRVTSDCPLFDPAIGSALLNLHLQSGADYSSNTMPRTYPKGLDCEIFGMATLRRAAAAATLPEEREHVTSWMIRATGICRSNLSSGRPELAELRWTLDYPQDFEFFSAVWAHRQDGSDLGLEDVLAIIGKHPEISALNGFIKS